MNGKSPFWLKNFEREIGVTEVPGPEDNPRILEYFKSLYPQDGTVWHDSDAWCAVQANFVLKRSGLPGTDSPAAIAFEKYGRPLKKPRKGCIGVYSRGGESWMRHVGLVVDENKTQDLLLAGNQDNETSLVWIDKKKNTTYRWPLAIEIVNAIKRRGYIRGGGELVGEQELSQVEIKKPWYKCVDWLAIIKTIVGAAGALLQVSPKFVLLGDALLQWGEKIGVKKKKSLVDLIIELWEAIKAFVAGLRKN